jgi:hypothetical protein
LNPPSRGFALIVTLSLMVLLTIVAVGLLSLSSISLRSSGKEAAMATARANARMAMMLALGELQKHAGPDQRVTARKDLASGTDNPLYTGVWDSKTDPLAPNATLDKTAPLAWLVSNPTGTPTTSLVSAANGGIAVTVPLQELKSTAASAATGGYAYWVGDEGVKARINLDSPGYRTTATATDAAYAFAGAPRMAIEMMDVATTTNPLTTWTSSLYPYAAETTDKLITTGELPLYATAGSETAAQAAAKARFHDLTAYSASVLSNTADGGLRQDLTRILAAMNPSDPSKGPLDTDRIAPVPLGAQPEGIKTYRRLPDWGRLRAWWNNPIDAATGSLAPRVPNNDPTWNIPDADTFNPVVAPIMIWCELGIEIYYKDLGVGAGANRYRLGTQLFPRVALWNPYSVPFQAASYEWRMESPYSSAVQISSVPIPPATATNITTYSYATLKFNNASKPWPPRALRFNLDVPQLAPGETKVLSLSDSATEFQDTLTTLTEGNNSSNYTYLPEHFDTSVEPSLTDPNRAYEFVLLPTGNPDSNLDTSVCLQEPGGVALPKIFQTTLVYGLPRISSSPRFITTYRDAPQQLASRGHCARMTEFSAARWLPNNNILSSHQARHHNTDYSWQPHYMASKTLPINPMVAMKFDESRSGVAPLVLREPRLSDSGYYQSIAQLQHAPLSDNANMPVFAVGNSLQNPRIRRNLTYTDAASNRGTERLFDITYLLNKALWDKYFFSTVPAALADSDLAKPLPNARLQPLATADAASLKRHDTVASELLLLGGFNINSTSEQAWRAVLAAAQKLEFNPKSSIRNQSKTLRSPFSRFLAPVGGSVDIDSPANDNLSYQGYRELTDAQIAALAAAIVTEVKTRGPFRSLGDFVNRRLVADTDAAAASGLKGALQAAIDSVDVNGAAIQKINAIAPYTETPSTPLSGTMGDATRYHDKQADVGWAAGRISPVSGRAVFGPGYLTQADVLSRIGSAIAARSDSFVIRTYGEARNNTGSVNARAYCEAVVQRYPDYVDPSTAPEAIPAANSVNERFGRRFAIVSFRWLDPKEI